MSDTAYTVDLPVSPRSVVIDPTPEEFRQMIAAMPNARLTEFDNYNVSTKVVARSKASTYVVSDQPPNHSDQVISREEYERVAKLQDEHWKNIDAIVVNGYIGNDPEFRTPARLVIDKANANVAAMQQSLYFPVAEGEKATFQPELVVLYTPNLPVAGYPNDRVIAVDLDNGITRVFNSDYFGESKKGGLRMWNKIVYDRGGLSLHAGCKLIPTESGEKVGLIVGLSGTGKTTTTFTKQNDSQPVQDDFCALMPAGKVYATENGCFAKTFGLDPDFEPVIYGAVTKRNAYLENVSQDEKGKVDFFDTNYTANGRAVIRMDDVEGAGDARRMKHADFLLILNCNESIIPAVARLTPAQAAGYFMLGETKGTSAGGAEEAGKFLRVPGTNPFFPMLHAQQGNRFLELLEKHHLDVYLMNTGRVGGAEGVPGSKKVKIPHSSAIVKAIAEGTITWQTDPDFGYEVATSVPGITAEDSDLLRPRELYEARGESARYGELVAQLNADRAAYFAKWPGLSEKVSGAC